MQLQVTQRLLLQHSPLRQSVWALHLGVHAPPACSRALHVPSRQHSLVEHSSDELHGLEQLTSNDDTAATIQMRAATLKVPLRELKRPEILPGAPRPDAGNFGALERFDPEYLPPGPRDRRGYPH